MSVQEASGLGIIQTKSPFFKFIFTQDINTYTRQIEMMVLSLHHFQINLQIIFPVVMFMKFRIYNMIFQPELIQISHSISISWHSFKSFIKQLIQRFHHMIFLFVPILIFFFLMWKVEASWYFTPRFTFSSSSTSETRYLKWGLHTSTQGLVNDKLSNKRSSHTNPTPSHLKWVKSIAYHNSFHNKTTLHMDVSYNCISNHDTCKKL